jgi:hypothetical protein
MWWIRILYLSDWVVFGPRDLVWFDFASTCMFMPAVILMINSSFLYLLFGFMQFEPHEFWFLQRGAFPLYPTQNGLMFLPLTFELPLSPQLQEVDIVLHKATDEIVSIDLSSSSNLSERVAYTRGMRELQRWLFGSIELSLHHLTWTGFFFFFFLAGGMGGTNMPMPAIDALSHEARLNYFAYRSFCDYATINLFMFSSWPKLNVCLERKKDETK